MHRTDFKEGLYKQRKAPYETFMNDELEYLVLFFSVVSIHSRTTAAKLFVFRLTKIVTALRPIMIILSTVTLANCSKTAAGKCGIFLNLY